MKGATPKMELLIRNEQDNIDVTEEMEQLFKKLVLEVLKHEGINLDSEVSLLLVDDESIRELNLSYRGMDKATDVLSFAMNEEIDGAPEFISAEENILGDIVISLETAQRQASEYGHSLDRELGFLTVHGMLHLLGYDHMGEQDTAIMRQKEEQILNSLELTR